MRISFWKSISSTAGLMVRRRPCAVSNHERKNNDPARSGEALVRMRTQNVALD
jgi:hypothetical protein